MIDLGDFYEICPKCGNKTVATCYRIKEGKEVKQCMMRLKSGLWDGNCGWNESKPMDGSEKKRARVRVKEGR